MLAATDPAQPYGAALPWPTAGTSGAPERRVARRPARVPGAHVVLVAGAPVLYVERGGRGLIVLDAAAGGRAAPGLAEPRTSGCARR